MTGIKFHPYADLFPLMQGNDYNLLKDDIRENGQIEPILLFRGDIIDGRNRYIACLDLGIEPKFQDWNGDEDCLLQVIVSKNLYRRHLTSDQRACLATDILPKLRAQAKERQRKAGKMYGENHPKQELAEFLPEAPSEPKGEATAEAAAMFQTNRKYVEAADELKEKSPELFTAVKQGAVKLVRAIKESREAAAVSAVKGRSLPSDLTPGFARLAFAILIDGIESAAKGNREDAKWLLSGKGDLNCISICDALGIDHELIVNWADDGYRRTPMHRLLIEVLERQLKDKGVRMEGVE